MATSYHMNHSVPDHAPHPDLPEASDANSTRLRSAGGRTYTPFQVVRKVSHHRRSAPNASFRRMWWWGARAIERRLIIRRRKELPGNTTWHACCSRPIRDSSSRLRHFCRPRHLLRVWSIMVSLSCGRRKTPAEVSISMPRKVRQKAPRVSPGPMGYLGCDKPLG